MIGRMFQNLEKRMDKMPRSNQQINTITKDTEKKKNESTMMNNTIMEIKSSLEGNNNRLTEEKK